MGGPGVRQKAGEGGGQGRERGGGAEAAHEGVRRLDDGDGSPRGGKLPGLEPEGPQLRAGRGPGPRLAWRGGQKLDFKTNDWASG